MTFQSKEKWWLDDARVIAHQNPYSFWLPSKSILERLMPGNHAKLIFRFDSDDPEAPKAERMWVAINEVKNGVFRGSLDNEPRYMTQIQLGDCVTFETRHVIDTDIPDPSAREFEQYLKRCFVTHRVLEDGQKPRYVYREAPDREDDSGWRYLAGDESDEYMDNAQNTFYIAVGKVLNLDRTLIEIFNEPEGRWSWSEATMTWQKVEE
jgi:hypothetical protein